MINKPFAFSLRKMGTLFNFTIHSQNYDHGWNTDIEALIEKLEQSWSRFRFDSELSILNKTGHISAPSEEFQMAISATIEAYEETGGLFDPRVLNALEVLGYDESFEKIQSKGPNSTRTHATPTSPLRDEILITADGITLHSEHRIDLGGIGKCLALEEISSLILKKDQESSFLIDAGGDIVSRSSTNFPCWYIAIEDPNTTEPLGFWIRLSNGSVATSSPSIRRWRRGGTLKHHLIDPTSMDSSNSDLASVTVVGDIASKGEVWSKSLFLMGRERAIATAEAEGIAAVFIDQKSNVFTSSPFARYIEVRGDGASSANTADHFDFSSPLSNFTSIHFDH